MLSLTENRLTKAIATVQAQIDERLDAAGIAKLDETLGVTFEEHFKFQQLQSQAHVTGKLTTDEAQIVYVALGEVGSTKNGGWAAGTTLATKVVVTQLMGELLQQKLA
jgi:hypothetical protein